ncbi:sorbosone dehydrogenase family protein [Methylobacillus flagellatus]|uniref:PQQ-dependent sugar dehydrogenase n=1 Tax=Methylobacillus flagellatus TaxID=405 RepID=UPI002853F959|nr:sorbosone dehydrogenase family protein [Methylobacillus flagellatus]MDR5171694.1 sorbosone dehydrogenase family protein [Methylobacillus flagellatus]
MHRLLLPALITLSLAACGDVAKLPVSAGTGTKPELPEPRNSLIPTVHVATAVGWAEGAAPTPAEGTAVNAFAKGLDHPRWLYQLPNGDILVAETNSPPKEGGSFSLRAWFAGKFMARAGAGTPSANRITLLRDTDGDGVADQRSVFLKDLHSPFGMALIGNTFYVANADAVVTFPYQEGATEISAPPTKLVALPGLPLNHHWTKNLIASQDGSKLYVTVGSNSNIGENGMDIEQGRAAIWEVDAKTGDHRIFASGLRNPNGLAWEPDSGALWTAVNERDEIGSDLVPDYITSVQEGGFYGWPYSYYGDHIDVRVQPQKPELVAQAIAPDYALGPHTASLGLAAAKGNKLPEQFANGMFVGQHGSWNRKPSSGYKVLFVPFADGKPSDFPVDVLTGFLNEKGEAQGRPVGVLVDQKGALLVADDVGNTVWRVTSSSSAN